MWERVGAKLALGIQLPGKKVLLGPHLSGCTGCRHTGELLVHRVLLCWTDSCLFTRRATVAFVIKSVFSCYTSERRLVVLPIDDLALKPLRLHDLMSSPPPLEMGLNKLLVTRGKTAAAVSHGDSLEIQPQWVCKSWRKNNGFRDPPHSATQVVRRTSVLSKLVRV